MLHRIYDPIPLYSFEREDWIGYDPKQLLEDLDNICLSNDKDFALFEYVFDGVYRGHYLFNSRGKDAVTSAKELLQYLLDNYYIHTLVGIVPIQYLGSKWLTRKLGFESQGIVDSVVGPCELFIKRINT